MLRLSLSACVCCDLLPILSPSTKSQGVLAHPRNVYGGLLLRVKPMIAKFVPARNMDFGAHLRQFAHVGLTEGSSQSTSASPRIVFTWHASPGALSTVMFPN